MAHILIIRFSAIGDVAMMVPVIDSLARQYLVNHYTVVSQAFLSPLFAHCPDNVRFVGVDLYNDYKGVPGMYRLYRELIIQKFDAVADLHDVLRTKLLRIFFRCSGLKVRHIDKGRKDKRQLTRKENKIFRQLKPTSERYADVFSALGQPLEPLDFRSVFGSSRGDFNRIAQLFSARSSFAHVSETSLPGPLSTGEREKALFDDCVMNLNSPLSCGEGTGERSVPMNDITGKKSGAWIGIAPFAKHEGKIFPLERMEKVVEHFAGRENVTVFLFGGGTDEKTVLNTWSAKYPRVISVAGKLGLTEELILMSHLDAMLSMDSANMHLASLTATPVVSVWGATHPYAGFYGYQQSQANAVQVEMCCRPCSVYGNKTCYRKEIECMTKITTQMVIEKIETFIN